VNLSGNKNRLAETTKELSLRWADTRNHWRDGRSQEFDRKYMQELFAGVDKAITVIEKLDEVLKRIQRDCE
jgi:hypothetical protein